MTGGTVKFVVARDLPYPEGVTMQREILARMAADPELPGTVILAEHRPVVTLGRSAPAGGSLLVNAATLAARGIACHAAGRGGDVTYHGPGQWTVYPVLRLEWYGRDLHRYLRLLEECVIRFLAGYGVAGGRRAGLTGVWVDGDKLAAVGVAVSRWIAWHGLAVNIHPDLSCFTELMHPCGIPAGTGGVTSLDRVTGSRHEMDETADALRRAVLDVLELGEA